MIHFAPFQQMWLYHNIQNHYDTPDSGPEVQLVLTFVKHASFRLKPSQSLPAFFEIELHLRISSILLPTRSREPGQVKRSLTTSLFCVCSSLGGLPSAEGLVTHVHQSQEWLTHQKRSLCTSLPVQHFQFHKSSSVLCKTSSRGIQDNALNVLFQGTNICDTLCCNFIITNQTSTCITVAFWPSIEVTGN